MKNSLNQQLIKKAIKYLKSSDQVISNLINKFGPCAIQPAIDNPFHAIASSIISQQLSSQAARSIKNRLFILQGENQFNPGFFLKIPIDDLRGAGLSRAKVEYIKGLALAIKKGSIDFSAISEYEDETAISKLVEIPGIGKWTAEMFLIFGLGRPDVLSVNDAGLKRGIRTEYELNQNPTADEMIAIGESWRPFRSVASWYIWRSVDQKTASGSFT